MKNLPASEAIIDALFESTIRRGVDESATYLTLHTVILVEMIDRFHQIPNDMRVQMKVDAEIDKLIHPDMHMPSEAHKDTVYLSMLSHDVVLRVQHHYAAKPNAH